MCVTVLNRADGRTVFKMVPEIYCMETNLWTVTIIYIHHVCFMRRIFGLWALYEFTSINYHFKSSDYFLFLGNIVHRKKREEQIEINFNKTTAKKWIHNQAKKIMNSYTIEPNLLSNSLPMEMDEKKTKSVDHVTNLLKFPKYIRTKIVTSKMTH